MVHKQFYPLKVASVRKTTADCTVVSFEVADTLRELFQYHCGQHLTLKSHNQGRRNQEILLALFQSVGQ